jgi:broad specificity phosphatase PhoE
VPPPVIYYVRHGLTDWNAEQRLQGGRDIPLNKRGRAQAVRSGEILRDLFARDGHAPGNFSYVSSPLVRARATMELMRSALGLHPAQYDIDPRLAELSFGEWEGLTYADILAWHKDLITERESNKWGFVPPAGESYAQLTQRIGEWYGTVHADTVVCAHCGTARALIAYFDLVPPRDAPHYSIDQGVVYVFADDRIARYT